LNLARDWLMTKHVQSIALAACVIRLLSLAVVLLFGMQTAQAIQCSAALPSNPQGHWSYRFIDGRKCWYQGGNMLSKSLLHWNEEASPLLPAAQELPPPGKEPESAIIGRPRNASDPDMSNSFEARWRDLQFRTEKN